MRGPGAARVCVFRDPSVVRAPGLYVLEHLMDFTFVGPTKTVVGSAPRVQCNRYRSGRVFERGVLRPGLRYHHGVETHSLHAPAQAWQVWSQVPAVRMWHTGCNPGFWPRAPSVPALPRDSQPTPSALGRTLHEYVRCMCEAEPRKAASKALRQLGRRRSQCIAITLYCSFLSLVGLRW